ncbi:MAG: hypothetical protein IPL46_30605, partial [Saprospiraceae bacterium]|nr:hypothetical protein [Saprospiraceae bacterium]
MTKLQQLTDITEILQMMKDSLLEENSIVCEGTSVLTTHTGNARSYLIPSKLFRIRLCDGSEYYIPEQFLNELSGTYEILQEIPVTDINQTFNIQRKSRPGRATLSELLPNIADGENLEINNYSSCQIEECIEVTPPVCDSASTTAQNHFLDSLKSINNNIDASALGYPLNLVKVLLCNGTEVYLLESELSLLPGNYTSIQT